MQITPSGTHRSATGPDDRFTGTVRVRPLFAAEPPSQVAGARTNWHTHPLGQTLIVTFARGWVQREGDVVPFAAPPRRQRRRRDVAHRYPGKRERQRRDVARTRQRRGLPPLTRHTQLPPHGCAHAVALRRSARDDGA